MLVAESHEPLIDIIERFNRKERYVLFQQVATEGEVQLSPDFRKRLCALGWPVPEHGVLILMDYHLNWLYAALELHAGSWVSDGGSETKARNDVHSVPTDTTGVPDDEVRRALENNQEDIDLLLVWESDGLTHLGLVETKAHSGWTNKQMGSKSARLEAVIGREEGRYPGVVPHFALESFTQPTKLVTEGWPGWMTDDEGNVPHLRLTSALKSRYSVGRADQSGNSSASGDYYAVRIAAQGTED